MNTIKDSTKSILIRSAVVTIAMPLLLCSCASIRAGVAKRHGLAEERLPFIEGRWRNVPKEYGWMLWENLTTQKGTPSDAVVALEIPDNRTLTATLLIDGVKTDSRTIKIKQRNSWFELSTQHVAHPLLWYVVWGWTRRDPAIGIDVNGNLWVNTVDNGLLVITVVPTPIGGGGGAGTVDLFERVP